MSDEIFPDAESRLLRDFVLALNEDRTALNVAPALAAIARFRHDVANEQKRTKAHASTVELPPCPNCREYALTKTDHWFCLKCRWTDRDRGTDATEATSGRWCIGESGDASESAAIRHLCKLWNALPLDAKALVMQLHPEGLDPVIRALRSGA